MGKKAFDILEFAKTAPPQPKRLGWDEKLAKEHPKEYASLIEWRKQGPQQYPSNSYRWFHTVTMAALKEAGIEVILSESSFKNWWRAGGNA